MFPVATMQSHRKSSSSFDRDDQHHQASLVNPLLVASSQSKFSAPLIASTSATPFRAPLSVALINAPQAALEASSRPLDPVVPSLPFLATPHVPFRAPALPVSIASANTAPEARESHTDVVALDSSRVSDEPESDRLDHCDNDDSFQSVERSPIARSVINASDTPSREPRLSPFLSLSSPMLSVSDNLLRKSANVIPFEYSLTQLDSPMVVTSASDLYRASSVSVARPSIPQSDAFNSSSNSVNASKPVVSGVAASLLSEISSHSQHNGDSIRAPASSIGRPPATSSSNFATANGQMVSAEIVQRPFENRLADGSLLVSTSTAPAATHGFQTGNGRPIQVTQEAFAKAQRLFSDERPTSATQPVSHDMQHNTSLLSATSTSLIANPSSNLQIQSKPPSFAGFVTGSGRQVSVSEQSLKRAKLLLDDESSDRASSLVATSTTPMAATGFVTGSGRAVSFSEQSLKRAKLLLDDEESDRASSSAATSTTPMAATGFVTGSGRAVSFSEQSLKRAKLLLDDEESDRASSSAATSTTPMAATGFVTGSGRAVSFSEQSLKRAKLLLDDEESDRASSSAATSTTPMAATGFVTGSGRAVSFSEQSLKRAKLLLDDEESDRASSSAATSTTPMAATGFVTGSGRAVSFSEQSLKRAKLLLDNEESDRASSSAATSTTPMAATGFVTGSGRAVSFSEQSLKRAKLLLDDEESDRASSSAATSTTPMAATGFVTGSGRAVSFSEQSLKRAKELLADEATANSTLLASKGPETPLLDRVSSTTLRVETPIVSAKSGLRVIPIKSNSAAPASGAPVSLALPSKSLTGQKPFKTPRPVFPKALKLDSAMATAARAAHAPGSMSAGTPALPLLSVSPHPQLIGRTFAELAPMKSTFASVATTPISRRMTPSYPESMPNQSQIDANVVDKRTRLSGEFDLMNQEPLSSMPNSELALDVDSAVAASGFSTAPAARILSPTNALLLVFPVDCAIAAPSSSIDSMQTDSSDNCTLYGVHTIFSDLSALGCPMALIPKQISARSALSSVGVSAPTLSPIESFSPFAPSSLGYLLTASQSNSSGLAWLDNHWVWVAWKLASLDRYAMAEASSSASSVPKHTRRLTYANILQQIAHRIHRELELSHRSSLKLIYERDIAPNRFMVLCVSAIDAPTSDNVPLKIELTDGWYSIPAMLDLPLTSLVVEGKIAIGHKLSICMAELVGGSEGCSPLEENSMSLKMYVSCFCSKCENIHLSHDRGVLFRFLRVSPFISLECIQKL
jgi:hypothetical protein